MFINVLVIIWEEQADRISNEDKKEYYKKRRLANKFLVCYYMTKYPDLINLRKKKIEKKEEEDEKKQIIQKIEEEKVGESPKKFVSKDKKNVEELKIIDI